MNVKKVLDVDYVSGGQIITVFDRDAYLGWISSTSVFGEFGIERKREYEYDICGNTVRIAHLGWIAALLTVDTTTKPAISWHSSW